MRLLTEKDFLTRSTEPCIFSEETRADISVKLNYISDHLTNLKELQKGVKMNKGVELLEHGKINNKTKGQNRCLNSRTWTTLVCEISLMEKEKERLTLLYNR